MGRGLRWLLYGCFYCSGKRHVCIYISTYDISIYVYVYMYIMYGIYMHAGTSIIYMYVRVFLRVVTGSFPGV